LGAWQWLTHSSELAEKSDDDTSFIGSTLHPVHKSLAEHYGALSTSFRDVRGS
jgi:hypothetical protein